MSAAASAGGSADPTHARPRRVAVVVAGAGARGGYEAGALSVLVPRLRRAGIDALLFVGTSAGAINATLFAATAHLPAAEQAEEVLDVWRGISVSDVFRSPLLTAAGTAALAAGQLLRFPGVRLTGLLDTAPLRRTAADKVNWDRLRAGLDGGRATLAIVATSGIDNRTVVFVDRAGEEPLPPSDDDRPIDYVGARIGPEHVLASAAIPAVFPPVRVPTATGSGGWYIDGGVRLNTPLKPALALGADAVAVVATHPPEGGAAPPKDLASGGEPPDVDDTLVRLMDAALVDRMVEDLHTLAKVNALVGPGGDNAGASRPHTVVPYLAVGPSERGTLGLLAADVFARSRRGLRGAGRALRQSEMRLLARVLLGDGPRRGDLLSYLYFDPDFIEASIEVGQRDAAALFGGASPDTVPWRTGP